MIPHSKLISFLDPKNPFSNLWEDVKEDMLPSFLGNVVKLDFLEFKSKYHNYHNNSSKKILIDSLLAGDIYILKKAFSKNFLGELRNYVIKEKFEKKKYEFHKILDGVPNFTRDIDENLSKNYAIPQIKTTSYFFPFNEEKEKFKIYNGVYPIWRSLKFISGYYEDVWEKNIPSDGIIDRLQVVRYQPNTGGMVAHTDPYLYQRFFISVYLSQKGEDFDEGGFYALDKNNEKIDIEGNLEVGDLCFGLGTIKHGVASPKGLGNKKYDINNLMSGRWFLGIYSTESDYTNDRHTTKPINKKNIVSINNF
jgi:hypothetical protein